MGSLQQLAAHWWPYLTAGFVALFAIVKRKAISAIGGAAGSWVKRKFFAWFSKNLPRTENHPHEKTYRGQFVGFFQYENPPHEWFFRLVEDGVEHTVPTNRSNLLTGVSHGTLVEIDTIRFSGKRFEEITRVRTIKTA